MVLLYSFRLLFTLLRFIFFANVNRVIFSRSQFLFILYDYDIDNLAWFYGFVLEHFVLA
jgi:hypothetical protein